MAVDDPLLASQLVVRVCLFLVAAIAMFGGALQMFLGQPETSPRLDNVHRFMAGVYFSTGVISLWAAITIRQQGMLVYLLALGVFLAGVGRLVSISRVGLPKPTAVWLGYLIPELVLPLVIAWHNSPALESTRKCSGDLTMRSRADARRSGARPLNATVKCNLPPKWLTS
jgi:hypothetical protein